MPRVVWALVTTIVLSSSIVSAGVVYPCRDGEVVNVTDEEGLLSVNAFYADCFWLVGGSGRRTSLYESGIVNRAPSYGTVAVYGAHFYMLVGNSVGLEQTLPMPHFARPSEVLDMGASRAFAGCHGGSVRLVTKY